MKLIKNSKELKTTIIGLLILTGNCVYSLFPYLSDKEGLWEVNSTYVIAAIVIGTLLILAPDRILNIVFGWLKKKSEE